MAEVPMRWFKPFGLIFIPVSISGWIVTILSAAFCVHIFRFVDGRSHSVSDTLYGIFPYCVPTFLLWAWIAGRTSGDERGHESN
jgi:hypothetical protein